MNTHALPKQIPAVKRSMTRPELVTWLRQRPRRTLSLSWLWEHHQDVYAGILREFGSLDAALNAAKVIGPVPPAKAAKSSVAPVAERLDPRDRPPKSARARKQPVALMTAATKAAGAAAGAHGGNWTKERVVAELRARHQRGELLNATMITRDFPSLYNATLTHFRGLQNAIRAAGLPLPVPLGKQRAATRAAARSEVVRVESTRGQGAPQQPVATSSADQTHEALVRSMTARIAKLDPAAVTYAVGIASETPRGMLLVTAMYATALLERLLRAACLEAPQVDRLLGGPLEHLDARLQACWCLGFLPEADYVNVQQIRQMQSHVARDPHMEDFSDLALRAHLASMRVARLPGENHDNPLHMLASAVGALERWVAIAEPILQQRAVPHLLARAAAESDARSALPPANELVSPPAFEVSARSESTEEPAAPVELAVDVEERFVGLGLELGLEPVAFDDPAFDADTDDEAPRVR